MGRRKVDGVLRGDGRLGEPLGRLLRKGQRLQRLTEEVRALLPGELAAHCVVADLSGGRLTLHADNASFATKLQFETPKLRERLVGLEDFAEVVEIRVRAAAQGLEEGRRVPQVVLRKRPPAGLLRRLAEGASDEGLRRSIERLDEDSRES